jgi:hypothetical protein
LRDRTAKTVTLDRNIFATRPPASTHRFADKLEALLTDPTGLVPQARGWRESLDPCRPGNREAVFQHLEMRDLLAAGNGHEDREGRLDHSTRRLDPRGELAYDRRTGVARQNIVDLEPDGFGQAAEVTEEACDRVPAGLLSDPGQRGRIAWNFDHDVFAEHCRDDRGSFPSRKAPRS